MDKALRIAYANLAPDDNLPLILHLAPASCMGP